MKKETADKKTVIKISPSLWGVWGKCALSLNVEKTTFRTDCDDYAADGTRLHEKIAHALLTESKDFGDENDDDAPMVRFAVETARGIIPADKTFYVETRLDTKVKAVGIGGTADLYFIDGDTITIVDHKTGWKEVDAEGNKQLAIYAHIVAAKNKTIKKWRGVIINARFNSTSYTSGDIDKNFLSGIANDILKRTAEKQVLTGNHCAYCPRLTVCKPLRQAIDKWLEPGIIDGITRRPEELAKGLRLAKPAEKLFDTIKKEAQLYTDLGGIIDGVSVEYTAGTRSFPRDMTINEIADRISLPVEKMIETSTISPAEATRRGADKDAINSIAIRPPRKGFKFN